MSLSQEQLKSILDTLRNAPAETEVFEFKEAKNTYDSTKLGKYFSALSNEANLKNRSHAWLIFGIKDIGIKDKGRIIVGSQFRQKRPDLDRLKGEIAKKTSNRITFIETFELKLPEGRIVMFQIPAAPRGVPIAFEGHYYGRDGEELSPLNLEEIDRIRSQSISEDWSAGIIPAATIADLDPHALQVARINYKSKFPDKANEVDTWDAITFLNKAKITIKGKITRAAILLLGREEAEHYLSPSEAKIRWVLKNLKNQEKDYEIFCCPLLLAVDKIYGKIRNLKYRYLKDGTLFPDEVLKYEPFVIREAINNCMAHQDYTKSGRINVVEIEDEQLIFTNYGSFIPGSVEKVVTEDAPEEYYRNRFLVSSMFNLKMVETAGGGIKKMFSYQRERFFPMPEYDLRGGKVTVTVTGKVLDLDFARVLARNPELTLEEIIALDKIQKKKELPDKDAQHLKKLKLIEGRKHNYFISALVASSTADHDLKAEYIRHRGFDDEHYRNMIIEYLKTYKTATRKDFDRLLLEKLPDILTPKQKNTKVGNLLLSLRLDKIIKNTGSDKKPCWQLIDEEINQ